LPRLKGLVINISAMKNYSPKRLAFYNAFLSAIFFSLIYWSFVKFSIGGNFIFPAAATILLFIFVYFVSLFLINNFLYSRIRIIYKTINSYRSKGENKIKFPDHGKDILMQANTEVMLWAKNRNEEIAHLRQMEEYRREFLGNVSHELKTPVFNIQGYVLTLLEGGINDPEINLKYLQRTEQSINRLISIIEDLEKISALESGGDKLNLGKVNIIDLCNEAVSLLEVKAETKDIRIFVGQGSERIINVSADKEQIMHVLLNLIDNSIKYGKQGGETSINFFDMDEHILVEIADNGIGITQENIPRLFERFFRVDKSRSREYGSTGLGLAIVKHILEAHGQRINVRSNPGIGTTFAFTLKKT